VDVTPRCSTIGCDRAPEAGRSRCRTCRRQQTAAKQAMRLTRYSERRAPDGTLLGTNSSFIPAGRKPEMLKPAQPVNVTLNYNGPKATRPDGARVVVCLPDCQIGYRRLDDGTLETFHDESAMAAALQITAALRPDVVVHLGDLVDFAPLSRFAQEPGFASTTQAGIDRAHRFLADAKAAAPEAEHYLIAGNHDVRAERFMAKVAPELARVKAPGSQWPAMSVPTLLRLDDLGITYVDGYPAGRLWLREDLQVIHGHKATSAGSTAALHAKDAVACTVMGHVHRVEFHARSFTTKAGHRTVWAASPGTLSRVDGSVPSFHSGTSSATGASIRNQESWQQGVGVITLIDGVPPMWEVAPIHQGRAWLRGLEYGVAA
jgi:predicted phosphodiesterase